MPVTAAHISDEALRQGLLSNIPDHRAIQAAWAVAEEEAKRRPGAIAS